MNDSDGVGLTSIYMGDSAEEREVKRQDLAATRRHSLDELKAITGRLKGNPCSRNDPTIRRPAKSEFAG